MTTATYHVGDVFDVMAKMPDHSVDLIITSPPFLALRSYLPDDHPDKNKEVGSEPSPAAFLDTLLALTARWRDLLAPHGSICVELGDTYSGSGGSGGDYNENGLRDGQPKVRSQRKRSRDTRPNRQDTDSAWTPRPEQGGGVGWPMAKSLCGIPHLYHLSLAYGINLLTGEESPAGQWRVRNVVAWCRPNPPVGALGDKFRPATSYMTIACMAQNRYFDLDAVRGGAENVKDQRERTTNGPKQGADPREVLSANYAQRVPSAPGGAPPLDYWEIPTQPYVGAHYAVYPPALISRPIKAMCPHRVCKTCGEPSRRLTQTLNAVGEGHRINRQPGNERAHSSTNVPDRAIVETLGWTDCGHDDWRSGVVFDPFAGTGTTLSVAAGHGLDSIGCDIDARNMSLARERVGGLFLNVEDHEGSLPV